jgi:hypothetical protein
MNKVESGILVFILLFVMGSLYAQKFAFGLSTSPQISWVQTNDASIQRATGNSGLGIGMSTEYDWKYAWKIVSSLDLALNQGGSLRYRYPGNYLRNSILKESIYNYGLAPQPAGSLLEFNFKTISYQLALKRIIRSNENWQTFIEIPRLSLLHIAAARGAIWYQGKEVARDENIEPDLYPWQVGMGLSFGFQRRFGRSALWQIRLEAMQTMTDLTKNNGLKANQLDAGDPGLLGDETYETFYDKSRAYLQTLSIRIGLLF